MTRRDRSTGRRWWLVLLLAVVAVAVVAVSAAVWPDDTAGPPQATGTADAAPAQDAALGVSPGAELGGLSPADLDRELGLLRAAGIGSLRVDVDWSAIEPVRGRQDFTGLDRIVTAAEAHGMTVLGLVTYAPAWASVAPGSVHGAPSDPAQFAAFAATAASRYGSRIGAWEVWNEQNTARFWAPQPDPVAYTELLRATATAIRAAAPGATVLSGGLAPSPDTADGSGVAPETFLAATYAAGAAGAMDAVAAHPYSFPVLPTDTATRSYNAFQRLPLLRDVMATNGDGGKQVWLTEVGAPTSATADGVSEQRQADIVTATLDAARTLSWVGPTYLFSGRDSGTDPTDREQHFGLLRADFSPKPAYDAVREAARSRAPTAGS